MSKTKGKGSDTYSSPVVRARADVPAQPAGVGGGSGDGAAKAPGFYLKPGRTITSKRGTLRGGAQVFPRDFVDGAAKIAAFVEAGHIEEVK